MIAVLLLGGSREIALTQSPRLEYRVVFANAGELARRLDEAGQQGFSCAMVARPEPNASVPGVVVVMSRTVGASATAVAHRVIKGGYGGTDLQPLLDCAGAENFRLCGVSFDEEGSVPAIVAVMAQSSQAWKYGAEVLVAGFDAEPAQGEPPNSTVVLRFADAASAWGLLDDPDYQPVKDIPFSITSRGQAVVAPEFVPAA